MTKKDQINYFDKIVRYSLKKPSYRDFGEFVYNLLEEKDVISQWEKQNDPTRAKISNNDKEVINAYLKGWKFHTVDGVIWYNVDNKDTRGPFYLPLDPDVKIVSSRQFNKLLKLGWISTEGMDDPHNRYTK